MKYRTKLGLVDAVRVTHDSAPELMALVAKHASPDSKYIIRLTAVRGQLASVEINDDGGLWEIEVGEWFLWTSAGWALMRDDDFNDNYEPCS